MANANGQANTIILKAGTYTLTAVDNITDFPNGLPAITSVLTIKGTTAATTILERDTSAPAFRILRVAAAGTLTLQRLTLRNGSLPPVFFISGFFSSGGGIDNSGTLTLIDCILATNSADHGGGLFNDNGTVTISRATFDRNDAGEDGGGLFNSPEGTVTIANSTFVRNTSQHGAGGIFNVGTVTLTNTTVAENSNRIGGSGGIENLQGFAVLQSTTVAENLAGDFGRAAVSNSGTMLLQNTIIARNAGATPFPDCNSATSLGNNLIGARLPFPPFTQCDINPQPTDLTGDPGLDTFTDNGTPGNGHFPLLSTSQAIDAGNDAACFRTDQLGKRRVGPCDIGAISFRNKDDGRHEEKDDHQHEENLVSRVQGSR
jgi:hypothetical protein